MRALMGQGTDFAEDCAAIGGQPDADQRGDLPVQILDAAVGMRPSVGQRARIESADQMPDLFELQEPRAFGHEQPERELNRRNMVDEIERLERVEQIAITLE